MSSCADPCIDRSLWDTSRTYKLFDLGVDLLFFIIFTIIFVKILIKPC